MNTYREHLKKPWTVKSEDNQYRVITDEAEPSEVRSDDLSAKWRHEAELLDDEARREPNRIARHGFIGAATRIRKMADELEMLLKTQSTVRGQDGKENMDRKDILLRAAYDLLKRSTEDHYVREATSIVTRYDDAGRDCKLILPECGAMCEAVRNEEM